MKKEVFDYYAKLVADKFSLKIGDLFAKTKKQEIVDARHTLFLLCKLRPMANHYIVKFMCDNGYITPHTTIISGIKKAEDLYQKSRDYADLVDDLKEEVNI